MKSNYPQSVANPKATTSDHLTPEQKEAIEILGKDLCVSAGAGSGKTGVLVERFVRLVVKEGLSIFEILCITFTDKAAGEMKQRVAQKFQSLGLERQRQEIEFAYISTIDSFCSRILRENALEAGLDPDFAILEEYEARFLLREMAEELLVEWKNTNPAGYSLLLEEFHCRDLAESSIELLAKIRSSGLSPKDIPLKKNTTYALNNTLKDISLRINKVECLAATLSANSQQRKNVEAILVKLEPFRKIRVETLCHEHIVRLPEIKLSGMPSLLKENLKELRLLFENLGQTYWERETERTKETLGEFLSQLIQLYQKEKRKRRVLDFNDLIEKAIGLLQTFPFLGEKLRNKFKHILVDEFQDTNKLQKTLLEMLKGEGNLFVVGDAHQSIYGFRYADVEVFLEHSRQTQEQGGKVIHLSRNFRSRPEIISFVNQIFKGYWGSGTARRINGADDSGNWRPLVAGPSFDTKGSPSIELILAKGEKVEEARKVEAHVLASRIKEIVENGELKISKNNCQRSITYGDFAILFRSITDVKLFEEALEEIGIPFFVVGGKGLYDAREIIDLVNLLQLIDNPLDEIKLTAVLRSPLVGINDNTLFWLAHHAKNTEKVGVYGNTPLLLQLDRLANISEIDSIQKERLLRFRESLERLRGLKERVSMASLVESILAETHYDSKVLASPDGRQSYANLRKFTELTRNFEKSGILGLPQLLKTIRDIRVTETRESEAPTDSERDDVVKILTIHKAKGLEFPVVAVADMGRGKRNYLPDILFSRKLGLGLKIINPLTKTDEYTATYKEIADEIKKKEEEEEERVLYVALTRAQEHLILSGSYTERISEPLKRLAETLNLPLDSVSFPEEVTFGEDEYKLNLSIEKESAKTTPLYLGLPLREKEKILQGKALEVPQNGETPLPSAIPIPKQTSPKNYIYSVTEIMSYHRCPRLYYFRYKLGLPSIESEEPLLTSGIEDELADSPWVRLGITAHRVLELYRPYQDFTTGRLEEAINKALEESRSVSGVAPPHPVLQEEVKTLKEWVHNFYSSEEGRMVISSREVRHELSFLFNYGGTPIRGKIDLLFSLESEKDRSWCILDFKSSSYKADATEILESYMVQMRLYSMAVKALFGTLPEQSLLFFLSKGKAVTVDTSPKAMKGLDEWLKEFFDAEEQPVGAPAFPSQRKPSCRWCEYSKYCKDGK